VLPPLLWMGVHVGVDSAFHGVGIAATGVSNDKLSTRLQAVGCASYSRDGTATDLTGGRPAQHCVCVCWHASPTPHSLLQNLHLCILPAVSLPASLLLLLQIRRVIKELHSSG